MDERWFEERVIGPALEVRSRLDAADLVDPSPCPDLALGIEACFRSEVAAQYPPWPLESTTDGSSVDLCRRVNEHVLEAFGRMWIDFGGDVFPFRAVIHVDPAAGPSIVASIGQVDLETGAPPRLGGHAVLLPAVDGGGRMTRVNLIDGRYEQPITWTEVFTISPSTWTG